MNKKKKYSLPYNGLHPIDDEMHVISDPANSIGKFNDSFSDCSSMPSSGGEAMGEALETKFIDKLPDDVADYIVKFDLMTYERPDGVVVVDTWEGDYEFNNLEDFIEYVRYEIEQSQEREESISTSLEEHLTELDRQCFDDYCESYELTTMLEDVHKQLTPQDREMLKNAKTAEEASTYLAGLMVKSGKLNEDDEKLYNDNVETESFPYYVTYYVESPVYEPAEGGYYYATRAIDFSMGFDSLEEARAYAEELAEEAGMVKISVDHYNLYSRYIGEGEDIFVETADTYGQEEIGKQIYESLRGKSSVKKHKILTEAGARDRMFQDVWSLDALIDDVRDAVDTLYSSFNKIIIDRPDLEGYLIKINDFDREVVTPFLEDI